jgi:excisionase family DNA binding protein
MTISDDTEALTIYEACKRARVSRTFLYGELAAGRLRAVKAGRKTLIRAADLRAWLAALPAYPARAA